jgi:hypothetical protein
MTESSQEDNDWAGRVTATVVGYVETVRSASTGKALVASRVAVYGLAMALIALIIGILFLVVLVRFVGTIWAKLLPFVEEGEIWPSYLTFGALFLVGGWLLWRKKEA